MKNLVISLGHREPGQNGMLGLCLRQSWVDSYEPSKIAFRGGIEVL